MNKYSRRQPLTLVERERIGALKVLGKGVCEIARLLNRDHSVISRELRRNRDPHPQMKGYIGYLAHNQAQKRKQDSGKRQRLKHPKIRKYVQEKLKERYSPEQISGRLPVDLAGFKISHEAIYQYVYTDFNEGIKYLPRRRPKRYPRNYVRKKRGSQIVDRVSISQRPSDINNRKSIGHWEADSIESGQSNSIINVLLERKSRIVRLTKLPSKHAILTHKAIVARLEKLPKTSRKSITYDNGTENSAHTMTNNALGIKSYFCEPYHSWEKGAVENINGLIRRYIPKKTDLAKIGVDRLLQIEDALNNRPRKCLNYKTPNEVFDKLTCRKIAI